MIQKPPEDFLAITYPTNDVQKALTTICKDQSERPVVIRGGRSLGKTHIIALLHHAINSPEKVENWAVESSQKPEFSHLKDIKILRNYVTNF